MASILRTSESKFLERARTALANARNQAEIKKLLNEYGINDSKLAVGDAAYSNAKLLCEKNAREDAETAIARNSYKQSYDDLVALFKRHRNQVLIFFKKQPDVLVQLRVQGSFPRKYNELFDQVAYFYSTIKQDAAVQKEMDKIKLKANIVKECLALHKSLLSERAYYDKELSESQDATVSKNAALLELKDWMDDFDSVAKIALYDRPQLLESLGIFVRS